MHTLPRNSAGHTFFLFFASFTRSKSALCHLLCEATCSLGTDKKLGNVISVVKYSKIVTAPQLGDRTMHIIHIFLRFMHVSRLKYNNWIEKTYLNDNFKGESRILKWGVNFCNNVREINYYFNVWGIRKRKKEGGSEKGGGGGWKFAHFTSPGSAPEFKLIFFCWRSNFKNSCFVFHRGFKHSKTIKALGLRPRAFISFLVFKTPMKHSHSFLKYYLNANVFSVLAVHIESKMIIFLRVSCCKVSDFFQVNFAYDYAFVWKMTVLLWKFNRHWRVEPYDILRAFWCMSSIHQKRL